MNVLSLFDGISVGQLALHRANIVVDGYFASEIDKYAMGVSNKQRYKCIGNGWTTDIIVHLLKELNG